MYEAIFFRIEERFFIPQPQPVEQKEEKWFPNYEFYLNFAEQLGVKAIREQTEKMIIFDFLIEKWSQDFNDFDLQRYHASAMEEFSLQLPYISRIYRKVL